MKAHHTAISHVPTGTTVRGDAGATPVIALGEVQRPARKRLGTIVSRLLPRGFAPGLG